MLEDCLETGRPLLMELTGWEIDVCVFNTRMGVSNTGLGMYSARLGVSNTRLDVSDTVGP